MNNSKCFTFMADPAHIPKDIYLMQASNSKVEIYLKSNYSKIFAEINFEVLNYRIIDDYYDYGVRPSFSFMCFYKEK